MEKVSAVILGCMSVAILLAEATLLPRGVDLSLFSILIKSVGDQEVLVQVFPHDFAFVWKFSLGLPLLCGLRVIAREQGLCCTHPPLKKNLYPLLWS